MTDQSSEPQNGIALDAEAAAKQTSFFARHKIAAIVSASALVLMLAGGGLVAYSLNADAVSPLLAATGLSADEDAEPGKLPELVKAEDKIADEVPDGAEVIEDANAPEGTTAVRAADGSVTYVATDKVNAAVSSGAAKPSASSGSSGNGSSGGSAPAPAPSKPAAPVHEHSFVATTVVDVPEKPKYEIIPNSMCGSCWYRCDGAIDVCPNCGPGTPMYYGQMTRQIGTEPAVTHTEYVCSCGARQ